MAVRLADDIERYLAEERDAVTKTKMVPERQRRQMAEGLESFLRNEGWVILPKNLGGTR